MSTRLATGGRLIDRSHPVEFTFNGARMRGYQGDTLASALLANDHVLMGRSFKYHRKRSLVAAGPAEPNALITLGEGGRMEPNQRATTTPLFDGLTARTQNHWPNLGFDLGAVNGWMPRLFPAGFYYKTFMWPRAAWKHLFEPVIRRSAGLGPAPTDRDADRYEHFYAHTDVLVVGGGLAGLRAAALVAATGAKVMLCEQSPTYGGRALSDPLRIDGQDAPNWVSDQLAALQAMPNVTLRNDMMAAGIYDHGYVLGYERVADATPADSRPRHRLWRIRAKQIIVATGAIERPLSFAGNDVPGVILASAIRDYLALYGVSPGDRTVVVTNNDDAYRTAIALVEAGLVVPAILDARTEANGELPQKARAMGIRVELGRGVAQVNGGGQVKSVSMCVHAGEGAELERIACEAVAMSGGWSPAVHLWSHCGGKLIWDDRLAMFRPDAVRAPTSADGLPFVSTAGAANGEMAAGDVLADAAKAGAEVSAKLGHPAPEPVLLKSDAVAEEPIKPVWMMPQGASRKLRAKAFVDFQNDVKLTDIQLAASEGFESVEHAKRYTTLGMATDQGKLSNINGLAVLSDALDTPIPQVGTTTFRPPYTPISLGSIVGEAQGALFKAVRKTPIHDWHVAQGARWEPVGDWRRPFAYLQDGERTAQAVAREVQAVRGQVGILDASTLGKILVKGPDAGVFLDRVYTNMMSTLQPGRCRYGLMCTENGFLFDDGVVARLSDDTFLVHTTTGNAETVYGWLEEWLQTEWWELKVFTVNLTEQFAQISVAGPQARKVLEALGGMDVSAESLPHMHWIEGDLAGLPVRVFRISFSGELSYEIAVPASQGLRFWETCLAAGADHGITPYGTEALHVLRAEKGFIMIGDETDGTVIPQDLGLTWAISKKKADYIGKRAQMRPAMIREDRKQLVGLLTEDPDVMLPIGAHAVEGDRIIGHVTSSYVSPTLGQTIAMALIERGRDRIGESLDFPLRRRTIRAKLVDPVFYDKKGERQNA